MRPSESSVVDVLALSQLTVPVPAAALASPRVKEKKDYLVGILMLFAVIILWTSSNFVVQSMMEAGWNEPLIVTMVNYSVKIVCLLPGYWIKLYDWIKSKYASQISSYERVGGITGRNVSPVDDNMKEIIWLVVITLPFQFTANWAVNASLQWTSVVSVTIISATGAFFTMILGRLFGVEAITTGRVAAVVLGFAGCLLTSLSDSRTEVEPVISAPLEIRETDKSVEHAARPLLGDAVCLLSAFLFALVLVVQKYKIKSEAEFDMLTFFGFTGLTSVIIGVPAIAIMKLLGFQEFPLPPTLIITVQLLVNSVISTAGDYLYVVSMLKTTPVVVAVGTSLTIPVAVIGDLFFGRTTSSIVLIGAAMVVASFVLIGVQNSSRSKAATDLPLNEIDSTGD